MANAATDLAKSNAAYAQSTGSGLLDQFGMTEEEKQQQADQLGQQAQAYYQNLITSGGYTPEQANAIIGQNGIGNVPGLDSLATLSPTEAQSNYLTPDQQSAIMGNPNAAMNDLAPYFNQTDTVLATDRGNQDLAVQTEGNQLNAAIDPSQLSLSADYGSNINNQVGGTKSDLDSIAANPNLNTDADYKNIEQMTPQQQQDIVNAAGTTVGNSNESALEAMGRQANAAGIGTLGQEALQSRMQRQAESDSADAETNARIAASNAAATREQTVQGTELGAAQQQAGLQQQGTEYSGSQALSALQDEEQKRLAAQEDISNRQLQAATTYGNNSIQNEQFQGGQDLGVTEEQQNTGLATQTAAEAAEQARAAAIANNTQATTQANNTTNYNRGASANSALSQRYGTVGNTQIAQENTGGAGIAGEQGLEQGTATTAGSQQLGAFGATTGATNQAAGVESGAQNQPGLGTKILGGVLGAVSAFKDGGVATHPTDALLGEDGPEMVVKLPSYNRTRPGALSRRYGQAAA